MCWFGLIIVCGGMGDGVDDCNSLYCNVKSNGMIVSWVSVFFVVRVGEVLEIWNYWVCLYCMNEVDIYDEIYVYWFIGFGVFCEGIVFYGRS